MQRTYRKSKSIFVYNLMNIKNEHCPVCHNTDAKYLFSVGSGRLVKCQKCLLRYYQPLPSQKYLESFYNSEDYRNAFSEGLMSGSNFATYRYQKFEKAIKKYKPETLRSSSRKFLDIGCGTGDFLKVAQQKGWDVSGTEISPLASQKANKLLGENCVIAGEVLSLQLASNNYDVITLYHVIEHLLDPNALIKKIYQLLKPGGILFIETPNIAGFGAIFKGREWSQIKPPEHLIYFQLNSLKYCLNTAGFTKNFIFTASPSIIESTQHMSTPIKTIANTLYDIFPTINMGALLQSISVKT